MTRRTLVLSLLWLALGAGSASAQITGWVSPYVGALTGGDATTRGPVWGANTAAFEARSWMGAELDVARAQSYDDEGVDDSRLTTVFLSAIAAPHRARIQPFAVAGLGLMRAEGCVRACTTRFVDTGVAATLGAGLQVRLTDWLGVRGDLRYLRALGDHGALPRKGGGAFDLVRLSIGATFIWPQM